MFDPKVTAGVLAAALLAAASPGAHADAVTDWNARSDGIVVAAKIGTPPAVRVMAIVQTAVRDAVLAIEESHSAQAEAGEAAVAAASRAALAQLLPVQQAAIDSAYQAALARIGDGPARDAGIAAGERAAAAVLAARADDGAGTAESYRPQTAAGTYVPTATPAVPQWPQRKPWLMSSAAQFRPGPPPGLKSDSWARAFVEVKTLGAKNSTQRDAAQTEIARFWEYSLPPIYNGVVRSVAQTPGRSLARNARLLAAAAQAMDDALIGVFEAKYHYNFWRPVTAIRNADRDGHDGTERDATWTSFIEAPMHPEYPAAHATLAGAVGAVLKADIGREPTPLLVTSSPTAKGATRQWRSVEDFTQEVADARVYEGVHYRFSTQTGAVLGARIGALAAQRLLRPDGEVGQRTPEALPVAAVGGTRPPVARRQEQSAGCSLTVCAVVDELGAAVESGS